MLKDLLIFQYPIKKILKTGGKNPVSHKPHSSFHHHTLAKILPRNMHTEQTICNHSDTLQELFQLILQREMLQKWAKL